MNPLRSFFLVLLASVISPLNAATVRPNVIILLTDDQGTLDANCYGSTDLFTPNMDRLAASGILFTQAYSHSVCCPARAALMTGRHPQRSGIKNWTQCDRHGSDLPKINMHADEVTLAEVLQSSGYRTALFGKWHLGAKVGHGPLDQGFDTYFGHLGGFIDNYRHYFLHSKGFHDLWDGNEEVFHPEQYYPELMIDRAVKFIQDNRASPFFMTIGFNLPHYPEQPIAKFQGAYADMPMPRQSYARVISSVDDHIGRVLDQLESSGLRDNTIVILMSDNGHSTENSSGISVDNHSSGYARGHYYLAHGGGGNTGKWIGNKGTFLEGGIRVPAIISYPARIDEGQTRDQIITIMDWFPSVLEMCGIEQSLKSPKLDGQSLTQIIDDAQAPSAHEVLHFGWANNWAVRKGDWKLIGKLDAKSGNLTLTLHHLGERNPEVKNHFQDQPKIVEDLLALHQAWDKEVNSSGPNAATKANAFHRVSEDASKQSALEDTKWLQYPGGDGPGKGKHIVLIAADQEYRSEQSMPMMAKIFSTHHGFDCTVLFGVNERGEVDPTLPVYPEKGKEAEFQEHHIPGLEHLASADLVIFFTRLLTLPQSELQQIVQYVDSGKPFIALRTANHGFRGPLPYKIDGKQVRWGEDVLGGAFQNHHGRWQADSTRGILDENQKQHPILTGVKDIWGNSDVYRTYQAGASLPANCKVLVWGQPLMGRHPDDLPNQKLEPLPVAWVKPWQTSSRKIAQVFHCTMGSGIDFLNPSLRRLTINAVYDATGLDPTIAATRSVDIVGIYQPLDSGFQYDKLGVKPHPVSFYR